MRGEWFSTEGLIRGLLRLLEILNCHLLYSILYSRLLLVFGRFLCFKRSQVWSNGLRFEDWRNDTASLLVYCLRHHAQSLLHPYYGLLPWWVPSLIQPLLDIEGALLWSLFNHYPFRCLIPIELKLGFHLHLEYFGSVRILAVLHHWGYYQIV